MQNTVKCFTGPNFEFTGIARFNIQDKSLYQQGVKYDARNKFLTYDFDDSNWDWYFNYLQFTYMCSMSAVNARCNYLLDLGYVPVIYLPSFIDTAVESNLFDKLDKTKVPYVKMYKTSFQVSKTDLEGADAWVSKMDAAKYLGCDPVAVTSKDFIRRLLNE